MSARVHRKFVRNPGQERVRLVPVQQWWLLPTENAGRLQLRVCDRLLRHSLRQAESVRFVAVSQRGHLQPDGQRECVEVRLSEGV